MLLSVIIPVYNELSFIGETIKKVLETPFEKEVIVVDDGSTDGTREYLKGLTESSVTTIYHERNRGKGAALRTGISLARGDIIIVQDADLEYDPKEYPRLLEPILDGKADVVYGSRFLGGPHRVFYFWHYMGNFLVTLLSNMLTNLNLTDVETGYKIFRREALDGVTIESDRFGFEPEITAKIAKKRCRIYEIPISYYGREYGQGKKLTWRDGIKAFFTILKYNLFR